MLAPVVEELQVGLLAGLGWAAWASLHGRAGLPSRQGCMGQPAWVGWLLDTLPPLRPTSPQEKYPDVTIASFDTTEEKLENVAADLGVKGLPAFKFFKVGLDPSCVQALSVVSLAPVVRMCVRAWQFDTRPCRPASRRLQDGKEVLDQIVGYKKAPLAEALEKLDKL